MGTSAVMSELSVVEDAPAVADPSAVLPAASANGSANGAAMHLLAANGASVMDSPSRALVSAIPGDTLMRLPSVPENHDDDFEEDDGAAEVGDGKYIFTNSLGEVKSYLDLSVPTLMGMLKNTAVEVVEKEHELKASSYQKILHEAAADHHQDHQGPALPLPRPSDGGRRQEGHQEDHRGGHRGEGGGCGRDLSQAQAGEACRQDRRVLRRCREVERRPWQAFQVAHRRQVDRRKRD